MLKEHATIFRRLAIIVDLALIAAAFFIGYYTLVRFYGVRLYPINAYYIFIPLILVIYGGSLRFFSMYESFRVADIYETLLIVFKATIASLVVTGFLMFFLKADQLSRSFLFSIFFIAADLIAIEKIAVIKVFRYYRKKGYNYKNILIVGSGKRAQNFIEIVNKHPEWGYQIFGQVDEDPDGKTVEVAGQKMLGSVENISEILHNNVIDQVFFIVPRDWMSRIEQAVQLCEIEGVRTSIAVDYFDLKIAKSRFTEFAGFPLVTFESAPGKLWPLMFKRLADVVVSIASLIILSPFFLLLILLVKFTSKGPVFFKQERSGLNGRRFILYKFRTMAEGAEKRLSELRAQNEMSGPVFKMEKDPRLTRLGSILRKFSLDEFPQIWNVLKGDMSIVGPRPPIPAEVREYDSWHRRRLSMRPGLTCLWQVRGRNKISDFNEWVKLDMEYIDHWSLWLDFVIVLRTVPVVLFGIGSK